MATWSLAQLKVMSAITQCRTAALGARMCCAARGCGTDQVSYNSCRNRHCPRSARHKPPSAGSTPGRPTCCRWVLPRGVHAAGAIADIAYTNKARSTGCCSMSRPRCCRPSRPRSQASGRTHRHTLVLHTWGSALTHHPHVHGIVPGGGLSADGERWVAYRPGFFLPVRVLSDCSGEGFLEELQRLHDAGKLRFFGEHVAWPTRRRSRGGWHRCASASGWSMPSGIRRAQAVLAYLSRYTHRVAISTAACWRWTSAA